MPMRATLLFLLLHAASLAAPGLAAELDSIGNFDFPTSGSPAAHAHFTLGVGYLHSSGRTQAQPAAALFEASLLRTPNRPWSLLGAARSHANLDHTETASALYTALLAVWTNDSHPAVQEAKKYLRYREQS